MPDISSLVGYLAATFTTCAFLPQLIQTIRTKDTRSIALGTYALFISGLGLWLTYGILREDLPVILANTLSLLFAMIIFGYKLRFG